VWGEGDEDNKLAMAITSTLQLADRLGLSSLALPAISTGIFRYPKERAARVILRSIKEYFLKEHDSGIKTVRLTLFDWDTVEHFLDACDELLQN
jgi:O-acetyl-ADP-ribose deacetylase (regulator of RNase III)